MFYKLLGMAVWKGGKLFLRKKFGRTNVPKPFLAAGALALTGGVVLLVTRYGDD